VTFPQQQQDAPVEQQFDIDSVFDSAGGGSGAPSYEWPSQIDPRNKNRIVPVIGSVVQGTITDIFVTVVKDATTKAPKLNKKQQQQPQVNLTLQTDLRNWDMCKNIPLVDPADSNSPQKDPAEDTGERRIYVKYRMLDALARAIKGSPQQKGGPRVGAKVAVRVKDLTYDKDPLRHPLPDYDAAYEPPVSGPADGIFAQAESAAWTAPAASDEAPF
jgi:hypothetical protein